MCSGSSSLRARSVPLTCKYNADRGPIAGASRRITWWLRAASAAPCVRDPGREAWRCSTPQGRTGPLAGDPLGRSSHIRSWSGCLSRATGRRVRPPPVAERAQPLAMLRAPWPRGLNLAAAGSPAGPGGDGECRARRLGQGWAGRLPEVLFGEGLPGDPASLLRAGGALRGAPDTPGLDFLTRAGVGGWRGKGEYAGLPLQQDCW